MSTKTFVQFGRMHYRVVAATDEISDTSEPWLMAPLAMQGDEAEHNVVAANKQWPLSLQDEATAVKTWQKIAETCDVWVDCVTNDDSSLNRATFKHEAAQANKLKTHRIIKYRKKRNIHLINTSHKKSWARKRFLSRNFSFFKLLTQAKQVMRLNDAIDHIIETETDIYAEFLPPPEYTAHNKKLVDMFER